MAGSILKIPCHIQHGECVRYKVHLTRSLFIHSIPYSRPSATYYAGVVDFSTWHAWKYFTPLRINTPFLLTSTWICLTRRRFVWSAQIYSITWSTHGCNQVKKFPGCKVILSNFRLPNPGESRVSRASRALMRISGSSLDLCPLFKGKSCAWKDY
ncbi:hypothetical protein BaRGS_00003510 [Batillaria attramentaria]|uniref:Uncharacterized protein n=1 Tax=Batillaria attramentaria TaxID=370345 RepID=A0ABD0M1S4_9CAEN